VRIDLFAKLGDGRESLLETHLWSPTEEETLTLGDSSLFRVTHEGQVEFQYARTAKRFPIEAFARQSVLELDPGSPFGRPVLRLTRFPHLLSAVTPDTGSLEGQGLLKPFFLAIPDREPEERAALRSGAKSSILACVTLTLLVLVDQGLRGNSPAEDQRVPIPDAYVKLLTTPTRSAPSQGPRGSQTSSQSAKAVSQSLQKATQSKSLQRALQNLFKSPLPSVTARNPAGSLALTGLSKASKELANLSQLQAGGPGLLGGSTDGSRLGDGSQAKVAGQGRALVSLRLEDASVQEGLTKDEVGEVIHRHAAEIRYCYEAAMLRRPDLEGKLAIAFTIGNIGSVLSSRVLQSSMDDPRLGDCVLAKLASWKFPKPKGGIEVPVTYPFVFKSLGKG